jgi:BirA family biotin operon repressor/biotin-[acetyl-CoA-carboxylase] ligase
MRDVILGALRVNAGTYVSGEDISQMLDVSRTAVWKHIQGLRRDGYIIDSNPRQGYRLMGIPDLLLSSEILHELDTRCIGRVIHHFMTIGSTNDEAKRMAGEGASEGTIVIAEKQNSGRGRLSRPWFSPEGGGIWVSLILRPELNPAEAPKFTFLGAVAVANAVRAVTGLAVEIKWPNDIHFQGRKLAGILTELSAELDAINFLVMGIGINVNIDVNEFPDDLHDTATSLQRETRQKVSRQILLRKILQQFEVLYECIKSEGFDSVFAAWRNLNCTLGCEVSVSSANQQFTGIARDIDREGALLIERQGGVIERVVAGDVSVRRR